MDIECDGGRRTHAADPSSVSSRSSVAWGTVGFILVAAWSVGCQKGHETDQASQDQVSEASADSEEATGEPAETSGEASDGEASEQDDRAGSSTDTTGRVLPPAKVLDRARQDLEMVERGECKPENEFELYTGGRARRVRYENALGSAESVVACGPEKSANWIDFYPDGDDSLRYRLFLVERDLQVQINDGDKWGEACSASRCQEGQLPEDERKTWTDGWDEAGGFSGLGKTVGELLGDYRSAREQ